MRDTQSKSNPSDMPAQTPKNSSHRLTHGAIIMPALNEEATIVTLLDDICRTTDLPVWLIDDGSSDETASLAAERGAHVVSLPVRLGAWGATQTGIRKALSQSLDYVVTMDADGQHDPEDITALAEPVMRGECDVVIGSATARGSRLRRWAWRLMRLTSGLQCEDLTSGFRVMNRKALAVLAGPRASYLDYQDVGVLLLLEREGLSLLEVPVAMPPRSDGKSRIFSSWLAVMHYMIHTLLLGASKRKRPWSSR